MLSLPHWTGTVSQYWPLVPRRGVVAVRNLTEWPLGLGKSFAGRAWKRLGRWAREALEGLVGCSDEGMEGWGLEGNSNSGGSAHGGVCVGSSKDHGLY